MTVGYFCATPLHIINAVNMLLTVDKESQADIFVYNHFADAKRIVECLEKTGLFKRCVYLDENVNSVKAKLKRVLHSFRPCREIREIAWGKFRYNKAVFFSLDQLTMTYLIKKGPQCSFYYGEDGLGSYINPKLYIPQKERDIMLKVTGRKKYLELVKGLYVHNPELLIANREFKAEKIDEIDFSGGEMKRVLEILWPLEDNISSDRDVLYFEEPVSEIFKTDAFDIEQKLTGYLKEAFGADKFYVKKHPRMAGVSASEELALKCNAPFERIMGLWDLDKTVLISVICTAALQPTLLCGKNPIMIFLYKMIIDEGNPLYAIWEEFFSKFRELYGSQLTLLLPACEQELKESIAEAVKIKHNKVL